MASENSDSEIMSEWTLLSSVKDEDEENTEYVTEKPAETNKEENSGNDEIQTANQQGMTMSKVGKQKSQKESATGQPEVTIGEDKSSPVSKESHLSSEIDVLEEEDKIDDNRKLLATKNSECSSTSCTGIEVIHEDLSDASTLSYIRDELLTDVDMKPGVRHYVHKPNTRLNVILNLVVVLAVTAVVGFGVGHFLGWSNQWLYQKQVTRGQVFKLKQLEEELIKCMEQENQQTQISRDSTVCYKNSEYWKNRFEELFDENENIRVLMEQTQDHLRKQNLGRIPLSPVSTNCPSDVSEDFHKLRLDLLVKQMEHLQFLKTYEEVKHQEKESRKRLRVLEDENTELKAKLEVEEENDKVLEEKVDKLNEENFELKAKLVKEEEDDKMLEQKVNELNEETIVLKAKLVEEEEDDKMLEQKVNELNEETIELKAKLVEEEEDDKMLEQKVNELNEENIELKAKLVEEEEDDKMLEQKVNELNEENIELKAKLVEEEEDDKILAELEQKMENLTKENILLKTQLATGNDEKTILANLEGEVREIHLENLELKKTLEQLQSQLLQSTLIQNVGNVEKTGSNLKIDTLRKQTNALVIENRQLKTSIDKFKDSIPSRTEENQREQLNELQFENQDLKNEIGRLRYMKPPNRKYYMSDVPTSDQSITSDLKTEETPHDGMEPLLQMLDTAHQESRHWEKLYKELKNKLDNKPYENWTEAITTGVTNGSKAVTNIITSVLDHISQQNVTLSDLMHVQLNATQVAFRDIKQNLAEKWTELQMITDSEQFKQFANHTEKLITRMSQTLQSAVQKIQDIGDKFVQSQKPLESRVSKLGQKVLKVVDKLEEQWADMKRKWSRKVLKQQSIVNKKFDEDGGNGYKDKDTLFLKQGFDDEEKPSDNTDNDDRYFQKNTREKQIQKKKENKLKYKKRKKDSNEHLSEELLSLKNKYGVKEQNHHHKEEGYYLRD
ncbi:interaptin-like isoform X2 [Limulus polyphemus]|uniref:Interaptin-like isoform X2 n=1 Tax=Limulus polyphemus TaxID=6850 RepID=A0ABM1T458_LIMPO|nr:interaptin-like isoform X2 [Limulus polyphemus]